MNVFAPDEIDFKRIAATVRDSESGYGRPATFGLQPVARRVERVSFRNDYSGTAPAYGLLRVTGMALVSGEYIYTVNRADATYRWLYLVNGDRDVGRGVRGWATWLWEAAYVLYDSATTPAYAQRYGPTSGEFHLSQHRPGFFIFGGQTGSSSKARVVAIQLPPGEVRVKNDDAGGTYAAGGTGRTFGIYGGSAGATDTGLELPLTNGSSVAWATDKYGWATNDGAGPIFLSPYQT